MPTSADSAICAIFMYKEIQLSRFIVLLVYTFSGNALADNWALCHFAMSAIYGIYGNHN